MLGGPFDERVCILGNWGSWRIDHVLKDGIEYRSCLLCQVAHERAELSVEVPKKQKSLIAENGEARVVDRADGVLRLEYRWHQWRKLVRQCLSVRGRLQGKAESKVVLAHNVVSCSTLPVSLGSRSSF